jgi:hypothetical protein
VKAWSLCHECHAGTSAELWCAQHVLPSRDGLLKHLAASTISRELRRNAATRSGNFEYRAITAQWHADRAASRPKIAKLASNAALRAYVKSAASTRCDKL